MPAWHVEPSRADGGVAHPGHHQPFGRVDTCSTADQFEKESRAAYLFRPDVVLLLVTSAEVRMMYALCAGLRPRVLVCFAEWEAKRDWAGLEHYSCPWPYVEEQAERSGSASAGLLAWPGCAEVAKVGC